MSDQPLYRGPGQKIVQARSEAAASVRRKTGKPSRAPRQGDAAGKRPRSAAVGAAGKRAEPDSLRADAAALRREFGPEALEHPDDEGGQRRDLGMRVSVVWLKNVVGFFLLPVAWVWTLTAFGALHRETVTHRFWATEDFRCFGVGFVVWMLWFTGSIAVWGVPRPMRWYVLGHEATHAVWTWLAMGRVSGFRFGPEGGHIYTNKPNLWVTLSPYFYPIYCVALILVFGVASFFYDFKTPVPATWWVTPMQAVWGVFGAAWSFHLSFTVWMIRRGQSDLSSQGNFFSLVLIYTMNLGVFTLFLSLAAPGVGLGSVLKDLLHHSEYVCEVLWNFGLWLGQIGRHPSAG
jgi:hypothetical protein